MKVVALVSGGKDSCYAMMQCIHYGHEIVALANLLPMDDSVDELDSYMYQTVGHQIVVSYAKCMGLPLFRRRLKGSTRHHDLSYKFTPGDEVEDMFILLSEIKRQIPSISAVSSGAIASDYQRLRVESVCSRLGLVSLAYLWKQDQALLLQEMITNGIVAIIVKVAAIGLGPSKHLGKEIAYMKPHLDHLNSLYGINVCGEGGEYESLTLDCPLFKFARIVLDDFQVILHSSDSIAPVGVLHPLSFHLEAKGSSTNGICLEETCFVREVEEDGPPIPVAPSNSIHTVSNATENTEFKVQISKIYRADTLSISCSLENSCGTSTDLQDDLKILLSGTELQLKEHGFSWEDVLYIHLYISDMNEFAVANETYISFITQEKCRFGVSSRSTIELPLVQAGLGKAYIEVLVAKDQTKRVLHVQSISCWAPSCIGPYSQATLYKGILHMAGQLGLDPPTMTLCSRGPTAELEQALLNSEAVSKCFTGSISTAAILFVIYCSVRVESSQMAELQCKQDMILKQLRTRHSDKRGLSEVLGPVILYVLVPDLPKGALVEVKPMLYIMEDSETATDDGILGESSNIQQSYEGFQHEAWHDRCLEKCVVPGKVCAITLSITNELVIRICKDSVGDVRDSDYIQTLSGGEAEKVAKFCVYMVGRVLTENAFSWKDAVYMRIYFQSKVVPMNILSVSFTNALLELASIDPKFPSCDEPKFNLVPVLGSGTSATSMDAMLTCEILAQKS